MSADPRLDEFESRVYRGYRMALRLMEGEHAAGRKQRARDVITRRYHLSHATLKDIVERGDVMHGIIHEPDRE